MNSAPPHGIVIAHAHRTDNAVAEKRRELFSISYFSRRFRFLLVQDGVREAAHGSSGVSLRKHKIADMIDAMCNKYHLTSYNTPHAMN